MYKELVREKYSKYILQVEPLSVLVYLILKFQKKCQVNCYKAPKIFVSYVTKCIALRVNIVYK
jgi:hypothetical protein